MPSESSRIAIFPGTFDPVTHGHLDIIGRAATLYEKLVVAVGDNPLKTEVFTPDERRDMVAQHTGKNSPTQHPPIKLAGSSNIAATTRTAMGSGSWKSCWPVGMFRSCRLRS